MRMKEIHLEMPLKEKDTSNLELGDIVYLTGLLFTGRVGFYRMLFEKKMPPPVDIKTDCNVNFHCSPAVAETSPGQYKIASLTGTASFRFSRWIPPLLKDYGVKAVIGKGGMQPEIYRSAFRKNKAVYLTTVGYGLGAVYGKGLKRVVDVYWKEELGLAQAMWILETEKMGPFLVESDVNGNSLMEAARQDINPVFNALYHGLPQPSLKRIGEISSGSGSDITEL